MGQTQLLHMTIKQLLPTAVMKDTDCLVGIELDSVKVQVQGMEGGVELLPLVKVSLPTYLTVDLSKGGVFHSQKVPPFELHCLSITCTCMCFLNLYVVG